MGIPINAIHIEDPNIDGPEFVELWYQNGTYYIQTNKDSNVPEIAFEVAVIIRCLLKDGFIKDVDEFVDFVKKYATDPQYGEVN